MAPGKLVAAQKFESALRRTLHQNRNDISHIFIHFFLSPANLISKFYLVIIE